MAVDYLFQILRDRGQKPQLQYSCSEHALIGIDQRLDGTVIRATMIRVPAYEEQELLRWKYITCDCAT